MGNTDLYSYLLKRRAVVLQPSDSFDRFSLWWRRCATVEMLQALDVGILQVVLAWQARILKRKEIPYTTTIAAT